MKKSDKQPLPSTTHFRLKTRIKAGALVNNENIPTWQ